MVKSSMITYVLWVLIFTDTLCAGRRAKQMIDDKGNCVCVARYPCSGRTLLDERGEPGPSSFQDTFAVYRHTDPKTMKIIPIVQQGHLYRRVLKIGFSKESYDNLIRRHYQDTKKRILIITGVGSILFYLVAMGYSDVVLNGIYQQPVFWGLVTPGALAMDPSKINPFKKYDEREVLKQFLYSDREEIMCVSPKSYLRKFESALGLSPL